MSLGLSQIELYTKLKSLITALLVLVHFDINQATVVSANASSCGIGNVLLQKVDSRVNSNAFATRALTPSEQRYAQIEKRKLSFTRACEKFIYYFNWYPL